jgi:hypothetical protein
MLLDNALIWIHKRINPILEFVATEWIVLVIHMTHLKSFCLRLGTIVPEADLHQRVSTEWLEKAPWKISIGKHNEFIYYYPAVGSIAV